MNEEYHVTLLNPRTEGVRETGAADIDPRADIALITIEGGNEPHGVFSFAPSARESRVDEDSGVFELSVDRKFGNIGEYCAIRLLLPPWQRGYVFGSVGFVCLLSVSNI